MTEKGGLPESNPPSFVSKMLIEHVFFIQNVDELFPSRLHYRHRRIIRCIQIIDIFSRLGDNDRRQEKHGDQVWNRHQSIEHIGDQPDEIERNNGCDKCH